MLERPKGKAAGPGNQRHEGGEPMGWRLGAFSPTQRAGPQVSPGAEIWVVTGQAGRGVKQWKGRPGLDDWS